MPGTLPVINRRAVEFGMRTALALGCTRERAEPVRAQALLLPGHAEELPDQPVRGAAGRARRARDRGGRRHSRHRRPAPPPGGGRRQAGPRGHARDRAVEPGGLQPRRRAADGDRLQARPPELRGGGAPISGRSARSCSTSRSATATWRRARSAATRTSRCGRRARGVRHQGRDQEPELLPERPARARVRGPAPGAGARRRASGSSRRRGSGIPTVPHRVHALEGVRPRLPIFPRARPPAAPDRRRVGG